MYLHRAVVLKIFIVSDTVNVGTPNVTFVERQDMQDTNHNQVSVYVSDPIVLDQIILATSSLTSGGSNHLGKCSMAPM